MSFLAAWYVRKGEFAKSGARARCGQRLYPRWAGLVALILQRVTDHQTTTCRMQAEQQYPCVVGVKGGIQRCVENYPRHATITPAADLDFFSDHVVEAPKQHTNGLVYFNEPMMSNDVTYLCNREEI